MATYVPSPSNRILSLKEAGFSAGVATPKRDLTVHLLLCHEDGSMLEERVIKTSGKTEEQLTKEVEKLQSEGFRNRGESLGRIRMQEVRKKNKMFLCDYKGVYGSIADYIYGVPDEMPEDSSLTAVGYKSPPHLRTWVIGFTDVAGIPSLEGDKAKIETYLKEKRHYENIEWISWPEMQKLR